jgi:formylglycine-generating enzyme required for sulfatase activity
MFENDGNTKFYLDDDEVTCEQFNDFFNAHDTGWCEEADEYGTLKLTIFRDDARS